MKKNNRLTNTIFVGTSYEKTHKKIAFGFGGRRYRLTTFVF